MYIGTKVLFLKDYQRLEDGTKFTFQLKWVMWYWVGRVKQKISSEQASSKVSIIFNVRCYAVYIKLYIWVCMYISLYIYKSIIYLPICMYLPISISIYLSIYSSIESSLSPYRELLKNGHQNYGDYLTWGWERFLVIFIFFFVWFSFVWMSTITRYHLYNKKNQQCYDVHIS